MKTLKNYTTILLIIALLLGSLSVTASASYEKNTEEDSSSAYIVISEDGVQYIFDDYESYESYQEEITRGGIANIVIVKASKIDSNNVKVSVQNIGIDTLDGVSGIIRIYNTSGQLMVVHPFEELNIWPLATRVIPLYCANWSSVAVSGLFAWDGNDSGTLASFVLYA